MALVSLIEFGVYAVICYAGVLGVIISAFRNDVPHDRSLALSRAVWLTPCIICAVLLMNVSEVQIESTDRNTTIIHVNTTEVWTETETNLSTIELQNQVWVLVHFLLFAVLLVYMIIQLVNLLTKV